MRRNVVIIGCLSALLASCTCGRDKSGAATGEHVARVNGEPISNEVFEAEVQRNLERHQKQGNAANPHVEYGVRRTVLDRLIDAKAVEFKVKELGVDPEGTTLAARFAAYRNRFPSEEAFRDYLERSNNTTDMIKADIRRDLLVEHVGGPFSVSGDEVRAYYDANKDAYADKEKVSLRGLRIVVAGAEATAEAKSLARTVAKKMRDENVAIAALAAELPGLEVLELGWVDRDRLPAETAQVVFSLEEGGISDPIRTERGFEVLEVIGKRPAGPRPYDQVEKEVRHLLVTRQRDAKARSLLQEIRQAAKIERLIEIKPPPQPAAEK